MVVAGDFVVSAIFVCPCCCQVNFSVFAVVVVGVVVLVVVIVSIVVIAFAFITGLPTLMPECLCILLVTPSCAL